jgi:hypothetical protein
MIKKKDFNEEIAKVAYHLYEKRGRVQGYELEDWLEAEKTVMERHMKEIEKAAGVISSTKGKKNEGEKTPEAPKSSKKASETTKKATKKK